MTGCRARRGPSARSSEGTAGTLDASDGACIRKGLRRPPGPGGKQNGGAVTLGVVRHRSSSALLQRKARLPAVQDLDLGRAQRNATGVAARPAGRAPWEPAVGGLGPGPWGHDKRGVGPGRQRLEQGPLVALEAEPGLLTGGAVGPDVGGPLEPAPELVLQVGVVEEVPAAEEAAVHIRDRGAPPCLWSGPDTACRPGS